MMRRAGADNRRCHGRLVAQPVERNLRVRLACILRCGAHDLEDLPVPLRGTALPCLFPGGVRMGDAGVLRWWLAAMVLTRKEAAAE